VNDELREQLAHLDPMHPGVPVESVATSSSRTRLEHIMNTPVINDTTTYSPRDDAMTNIRRNRRRPWMLGIAAAAVAAIAGAGIIVNLGGNDAAEVDSAPLELSVHGGDALTSCMMFDVSILADMSPAFAATATGVDDAMVTLTVDRWYTGGDADTVVLHSPDTSPGLIAGFEFAVGKQYLITAAEGNVNFCGYSGLATPELTAAFDAAFPG
jgi:hypothetical protein